MDDIKQGTKKTVTRAATFVRRVSRLSMNSGPNQPSSNNPPPKSVEAEQVTVNVPKDSK